MPIWVKLKAIQYISENGRQTKYNPGDWVKVGRQQAQLWLAQGAAEIPNFTDYFETLSSGSGIVTDNASKAKDLSNGLGVEIPITQSSPAIEYEKTCYWHSSLKLRPNLIPVGLSMLETWEVAIPFESYERLAVHVGSAEQREEVEQEIHDLRVPLYSTRLIFARKLSHIEALINEWQSDTHSGFDTELALLRSIYRTKPFILALPTTWIVGRPSGV